VVGSRVGKSVESQGTHEAIIDADIFDKVQEKL